MDKWKGSKGKLYDNSDNNCLLPPTKKVPNYYSKDINPQFLDLRKTERRTKKWSIDGFIKKVSTILDAQSCSSDIEEDSSMTSSTIDRNNKTIFNKNNKNNIKKNQKLQIENNNPPMYNHCIFDSHLNYNSNSRSSDYTSDGFGKKMRKGDIKARVEAKRDQLCGDSSMDESFEEACKNGCKGEFNKRRSRSSRTERYVKRTSGKNGLSQNLMDAKAISNINYDIGIPIVNNEYYNNDRYYCVQKSEVGINPLVQQTLQYFSDYDKNMSQKLKNKGHSDSNKNKCYKSVNFSSENSPVNNRQTLINISNKSPTESPLRNHQSNIYPQKINHQSQSNDENFFTPTESNSNWYKNFQKTNEHRGFDNQSNHKIQKYNLPQCTPKNGWTDSRTKPHIINSRSINPLISSTNVNRHKLKNEQNNLSNNDSKILYHYSTNNVDNGSPSNEKRNSKNLEEAICELEEIYNSLQLGDEDLLERAEQRTMEEFQYKGFLTCPNNTDELDSRRKTWANISLNSTNNGSESPDRLRDDMAYRRMHPKDRPASLDGQSSVSNISYLMTSPIPSPRGINYIDFKNKSRRKEPDITLDDVVFRNIHYANNKLRVVEPQPPFGIPIGPITAATGTDYLHSNPIKSERSRSPYIPNSEPDLITDDLAFRNLRKDSVSHKNNFDIKSNQTNNFNNSEFNLKKKRAVKSLSANLYGIINKIPTSPDVDSEDCLSIQESISSNSGSGIIDKQSFNSHINATRQTSDTEAEISWRKWKLENLNLNKNKEEENFEDNLQINYKPDNIKIFSSDYLNDNTNAEEKIDIINRDKNIQEDCQKDNPYISSTCTSPSCTRDLKPFTEQEISVYKQLCDDLENLVQLTKGIDTVLESRVETINTDAQSDKKPVLKDENLNFLEILDKKENSPTQNLESKSEEKCVLLINESTNQESVINKKSSDENKIITTKDNNNGQNLIQETLQDSSDIDNKKVDISDLKSKQDSQVLKLADDAEDKNELLNQTDDSTLLLEDKNKNNEIKSKKNNEKKEKDPGESNIIFRGSSKTGSYIVKEKEISPFVFPKRGSLLQSNIDDNRHFTTWEGMKKCNHKSNSMPAKTSSILPFRNNATTKKNKKQNRKSMCTIV